MLNIKRLFIISLVVAAAGYSQSKVGTAAAPFLNIAGGARNMAMGGATAANPSDATAIFTNVAGITGIGYSQATFTTADWFVGTTLTHSAAVLNMGKSVIGLSMKQLDYGSDIVTTVADPEGTGETWKALDQVLGLSYATNLTDRFALGGTFKYISQEIYHESSQTIAVDVGLLFNSEFHNLRIGMSINNFGLDAQLDGKDLLVAVDIDEVNAGNNANISGKLSTDAWPLPLLFTVGLSADILDLDWMRMQVSADALHPNNNDSYIRAGAEAEIYQMIYLRCGHSAIFRKNAEDGLSLGAGLKYNFGAMRFGFDYSSTDFGRLGRIPQWGISLGI